ncbi:unnamed protein product [Rhizophagus irregularis]|nr:unnamed protein product [Rhizophagus irregularis]
MPREKSSFWSEFEEKTDQNGKKRFQCKHCDSTNIKKRKQTKINNYMQSISNEDQQELEFLLARAFYSTGIPFNTIDNEDFQIFLKKTCPLFKIPTRQSLSVNLLNNDYKNIRVATKNVLNETPYFCLTSDGWSNINKEPLINYIIITLKPIFYKSVNTKEQSHNAENIAKGIENVMIEAGINKFVAVITDNANNMKAAWRILKEKYPNKIFLGCWTHGINLWVKNIIKHNWANEILNMAKKLSLYFRNHQIPLAALPYQCLDSIFKSKMAMMALLKEDIALDREIKIKILDDIFWTNLKDFVYAIQKAEYRWNEFLYNSAVLVAYRLDLRLAGEENQNLVLEEYSKFIGGFSKSYLWGDIKNKPINWWHLLEKRYPLLSSIALKLLSIPVTSAAKLVKNGVTIENSEEKETEDNIEILDDFEKLNEMYLEQDLSEKIEEE